MENKVIVVDGDGIPITLDEVKKVVQRRIPDPEYLLFLMAWAIDQIEKLQEKK